MLTPLETIAAEIVSSYALAVPTVGQNLRSIRGKRDQGPIARRMGVTQSQLSNWERDRYKQLTMKTLLTLAKGYECTIEEIVAGVDSDYGDRRDLIRQSSDQESNSPERGVDVPASPEIEARRVESRYRELVSATQAIASELFDLAAKHGADEQSTALGKTEPGSRRSIGKARR